MSLLHVEGLTKIYPDGTKGLDNLNLEIKPGEFVVVIGPSGAGKSTLLRSLNRMIEPTHGKIRFKGMETMGIKGKKLREMRRHMGMIFQGYNLVTRLSVLQNVLHGRLGYMSAFKGAFGLFSKADTESAKAMLQRVGLYEQMYKRADELSGGQQQRVGIARALSQKPDLILADEPIASLDPASSETIMHYLYTICKEEGIACLCNLHQVDVAKKYATRIIGIHKGSKVFDGTPDELTDDMIQLIYNRPQNKVKETA